jgi:sarcosine oxidase subunit alpha
MTGLGRDIDRNRPLRFRLNGRRIEGFLGDTVLSAALASGIDTAGLHRGQPLALDERFAPVVLPVTAKGTNQALPMSRLPAIDGADLMLAGHARNWLGRLKRLRGPQRSLGLDIDTVRLDAGWSEQADEPPVLVELAIVGGGIAGLSAALAAGKRGTSVVVIERRQSFGGNVRLFGALEGEEMPDAIMERLLAGLMQLPNVTLLPRTEALSLRGETLRAHQVEIGDGSPVGRMLRFTAQKVLLATGCVERLPVFPGNRLPGVAGLATAFDRADRFGVGLMGRLAINTSVNAGYRLAMLASDAGSTVVKMSDTRSRPNSRFIEFSKAYGMPLTSALLPSTADIAPDGGLSVQLAGLLQHQHAEPPFATERFIVVGGWQPDLALWLGAGGEAHWEAGTLVHAGSLPNLVLAGAAAGYRSLTGCAQSGVAAVAALFGRTAKAVREVEVEALYETPDGATGVAPASPSGTSYLDGGSSLVALPAVEAPRRRLFGAPPAPQWSLTEHPRALGLGDVAAGVQLGVIPPEAAATVAQERCLPVAVMAEAAATIHAAARPQPYPAYLHGRFGSAPVLRHIVADDGRNFEAGALLFSNSDRSSPGLAVGVVVGPAERGDTATLALIDGKIAQDRLVLRDAGQQVWVRLLETR